jgi:hypothetical protein
MDPQGKLDRPEREDLANVEGDTWGNLEKSPEE